MRFCKSPKLPKNLRTLGPFPLEAEKFSFIYQLETGTKIVPHLAKPHTSVINELPVFSNHH